MHTPKKAAQRTQYLTFFLGGEELALNVLRVKEIIEYDTLTKLPTAPPSIRGVINLRGSVVPVVDLAFKLGFAETRITKRTCIVMVEVELAGEEAIMGLMTDSVNQVIDFLPEDIEKPPLFGTSIQGSYLKGMGKAGKKFVLILDIDRLLSEDELLTGAVPSLIAAKPATDTETGSSVASEEKVEIVGCPGT